MNLALLTNGTRARQGRSSRPGRNGLIHSSTNSALAPQNTSLDAAALQAHFTRSLNLSLGTKDFTRSRRARPSQNRNNRQNNQPSGRPGFERTGRRRRGDDSSGSISSSSNIPATTLAQKRGLVQGPKMLSEEEWKAAELMHEQRAYGTKQKDVVCPICCENLGIQDQVILCCSHVFHHSCLVSFEKFIKNSIERTCPMCRKKQYQKHSYHRGAAMHRHSCACEIQRFVRGFRARRKYGTKLASFYGTGAGNRDRAHTFFANRVGKATDKLVSAMEEKDSAVDALFAELDQSLAMSRSIFGGPNDITKSPSRWDEVRESALKRCEEDCPICMCSFAKDKKRSKVLLSCSHVFHEKCIKTFESFNGEKLVNTCPVCRSAYTRVDFEN